MCVWLSLAVGIAAMPTPETTFQRILHTTVRSAICLANQTEENEEGQLVF